MKTPWELPIRILTHNIRYATSSPFKGERPWGERKHLILNELQYHTRHCQTSFICLQEVLHIQLAGILSGLNHDSNGNGVGVGDARDWAYIGVGRDDGHEAGEYSPIFYRPTIWQLRHQETVWLSETPSVPSKSWDAASIRIVTIGVFTHRASRKTMLAMNTHLDDQGSRSRFEAAHIILNKIQEYRTGRYGDIICGCFLAGDLNSEETQEAYQVLTAPNSVLVDTSTVVEPSEHYGNWNTFTGFCYEDESPKRLDYVLIGPKERVEHSSTKNVEVQLRLSWTVDGYAVLTNRFDDGVYNSDHRAAVADIILIEEPRELDVSEGTSVAEASH